MYKNISQELEEFFKTKKNHCDISAVIFICRNDGTFIFARKSEERNTASEHYQHYGVLLSATWQAASSLGEKALLDKREGLRLSFDSSDEGIYAVPMSLNGGEYFLGAIFKDEVNPGALKNRVRALSLNIESFIESKSKTESVPTPKEESVLGKNGTALFEDLRDDEVDQLFSF